MIPYTARRITPLAQLSVEGWQLKRYSVCVEGEAFDETRFTGGVELALETLPRPAQTSERPGAGFLMQHQGNGIDYTVVAWWDRENELPIKVYVCDRPGTNDWRPAGGSESICVWDLEVIWAERNAYVQTVLASTPVPNALDAYLERTVTIPAPVNG